MMTKQWTKSKAIITIGILILMAAFFIITWTQGVQVSQDNTKLKISGGIFYSVQVDYSDIRQVKLITSLDCGSRSNGISMGSYQLGNFKNSDYGSYKLFVNRSVLKFIEVQYGDNKTVVFNCKDDETTQQVYESLLIHISNSED